MLKIKGKDMLMVDLSELVKIKKERGCRYLNVTLDMKSGYYRAAT